RMRTPSGAWQPATLDALNANSGGWTNFTMRQSILSAIIPAAFTQVRFSFQAASNEGLLISKCYIGIRGTGQFDFASAPVQALFGGSASVLIPQGTTQFTDTVSLTRTAGQDVVISAFTASGQSANDAYRKFATSSARSFNAVNKAGDDATTLVASGYSVGNPSFPQDLFLDDFEV